jgi:hypothetical protein
MNTTLQRILSISLFVLLLGWGGYTAIVYMGVPVHQSVMLTAEADANADRICNGVQDALFCQGLHSFFPAIAHTLGRAAPFLWYVILSLVVLGIVMLARYLRTGDWKLEFRFTPLKFFGACLASLWLLFTVLTFIGGPDAPIRRIAEPTAQLYENAGPQALASLKANFDSLKQRGCLKQIGTSVAGWPVYDMKMSCMQQSFITRVLPQLLFVLFVLLNLLTLGRTVLSLVRRPVGSPMLEAVLSSGLGACVLVAILWLLAVLSIYTPTAGWMVMLVIPVLCYRHAWYWLQRLWTLRWTATDSRYGLGVILAWLLISYLALNFLTVVRPFPIGWDDLGRYINQPRLLVSYGHHIPTMASFFWEYITSLGFLMFGYDSIFGATASMMMNWLAGLLAVACTYVFGRTFLGREGGIASALLYYVLPMVGHFSFADMKIDNAVYLMGALSILATFLYLFPVAGEKEEEEIDTYRWDWRWMMLAGMLAAFAFGMKATSIMVIMALGVIVLGASVHWTALVGAMSLAWAFYLYQDRLNLKEIGQRVAGNPEAFHEGIIMSVFLIVAAAFLGYSAWFYRNRWPRALRATGIFLASLIVCVLPWILYNNFSFGNIIPRLAFTSANNISPEFEFYGDPIPGNDRMRSLPVELRLDPKHPYCQGTAKTEELDRYWGYRSGWTHYLTLPWRATMNLDSAGYYVTLYAALLLFPLVLLVPAFWLRRYRWMQYLFIGTVFMMFQWMFFANGIIWYGLGMFFGLCVALEFLAYRSPGSANRSIVWLLLAISMTTAFAHRFWQLETQQTLLEYPMGKVSAEAMRERTISHYDDIREVVMNRFDNMPERPFAYRIGTFIPYFIPHNLEVLPVADNQLSTFNCLAQGDDAELITKRLKALGFNSIIFDTNTATIEQDPNGTLHQKVQRFVDYVNNPKSGLQIVIFDPDSGIAFILIP